MDKEKIQELSECIQSSNLNFLLGAGACVPFLPLLGNIEKNLNSSTDSKSKEAEYKKYFSEVMVPNKNILNDDLSTNKDFQDTKVAFENFFKTLSVIVIRRKSTILSKQINLFTTNIDILMEFILEELRIEYNDGFAGRFNPVFSLENFKRAIHQRSLHFEHISEIPVFNIIKMHGSLTWKYDIPSSKIVFSHRLEHIDESLIDKTNLEFESAYKKILIINPEETKHLESVLNLFYSELLRLYSSELEKENALLFVIGFSMEDKHIREITLRAAKSNPTARIFLCCSQMSERTMRKKMEIEQHPNIQVFTPEKKSEHFNLHYLTESILCKVIQNKNRP